MNIESEKSPERDHQEKSLDEIKMKGLFDRFMALSDEPGEYIVGEKDKLIKESGHNPEALKRLEENKKSKFRMNSLSVPLGAASILLGLPEVQMKISKEKIEELEEMINQAHQDISNIRYWNFEGGEIDKLAELIQESSLSDLYKDIAVKFLYKKAGDAKKIGSDDFVAILKSLELADKIDLGQDQAFKKATEELTGVYEKYRKEICFKKDRITQKEVDEVIRIIKEFELYLK